MPAVAYLRKSRVTSDRHVSWEVQERAVRDLAAAHGDPDVTVLSDWGVSGRGERTRHRAGFQRLKAAIADGSATVVYSYSLSRLARSLSDYAALAELCRDHSVPIRLVKEGTFEYSTATGRLIVDILARFAQFEAELAQERAAETIAIRRGRGDHVGQAPYGYRLLDGKLELDPEHPTEDVLEAYRVAGTYHGAARLLNASGVDHRDGKRWSDMTVRAVVARATGADHRPARPGRPARIPALLAKLLRCHCGGPLSPTRDTTRLADGTMGTYQNYVCWRSRHDATHPRPTKVAEAELLPWVRDEAARFRPPGAVAAASAQHRAVSSRDELLARRQRVIDNYEDGLIGRDERTAKVAAIDADIADLEAVATVVVVVPPAIDWDNIADVEAVNMFLRAIWNHVELGPDLRPVRADWGVPPEYVA